MNRTARIGALVGTVAMVMGLGITSATPALAHGRTGAATANPVNEFFEPGSKVPESIFKSGAKLTIKRNANYVRSLNSPVRAQPHSRVIDAGESCGTTVIDKTTGSGKTTLVLSVSQEQAVKYSGEGGISKGMLSIAVGFDVTKSYKVTNETRFEVPKHKFGTVEAYTLYHHYRVQLGWWIDVFKPVGVCFNQWAE